MYSHWPPGTSLRRTKGHPQFLVGGCCSLHEGSGAKVKAEVDAVASISGNETFVVGVDRGAGGGKGE